MIRLCEPCRTGVGAASPDGKYHAPHELCASRITRCSNRPGRLRAYVVKTATQRRKGGEV